MQTLVSWLWDIVVNLLLPLAVLGAGAVAARSAFHRIVRLLNAAAELPSALISEIARTLVDIFEKIGDLAGRMTAQVVHVLRLVFARRAGRRRSRKLFQASQTDAAAAAVDREAFIRRALAVRPVPEILEVPPGVERRPGLVGTTLSGGEEAGQDIRVRYQQSEELLLYGRVRDCLVCLTRLASLEREGEGAESGIPVTFDMSLRRLQRRERRRGDFEWIVTIGTASPDFFRQSLLDLRDWLGIGIEFARPSPAVLHAGRKRLPKVRSCRNTPDNIGTVAGTVRSEQSDAAYALTCSHVIPQCPNMLFNDHPGEDVPDATLARIDTPCFTVATPSDKPLPVMTAAEIADLVKTSGRVRRIGGYSRRHAGWLTDAWSSYRVGDRFHSFPACKVVLDRTIYFGFCPWPLFRRRYSLPGDSGAWVVAPPLAPGDQPRLLGMIHAGGIYGSYVILAEPLLAYFEKRAERAGATLANLLVTPFEEGAS
jgi:hypothetical protein